MERYLLIGKINRKLSLRPHLIIAIIFICISPILMGMQNLNEAGTAKVLEMYVALIGVILLTPVSLPEQDKDIRDLVEAKYTSEIAVILIRILEAAICLIVLIGVFIITLKSNNCTFPVIKFYLGTMADAFFLGGMGFCAYRIFDQIAIAYMLPIVYYMLNFGGGQKLLKNYFLFSMCYGEYHEKVNLGVAGLILIIAGVFYPYVIKRLLPKIWYRNKLANIEGEK